MLNLIAFTEKTQPEDLRQIEIPPERKKTMNFP